MSDCAPVELQGKASYHSQFTQTLKIFLLKIFCKLEWCEGNIWGCPTDWVHQHSHTTVSGGLWEHLLVQGVFYSSSTTSISTSTTTSSSSSSSSSSDRKGYWWQPGQHFRVRREQRQDWHSAVQHSILNWADDRHFNKDIAVHLLYLSKTPFRYFGTDPSRVSNILIVKRK